MWVSRAGFPIGPPIGGHHRGTTPSAHQDENRAPERQPSRASDFGMLIELSTKLPWHYPSRVPSSQSISRAEQRVLRALPRPSSRRTPGRKPGPESLTEPNSEFSRQKIANSVQPWSELAILRSPKAKTHDNLRYRKAHTRTTGKIVHFSLPRPRKTVCFDRQRPKQTVFRIAHPPQGEGGAGLEGLMQTTRNQARLPLHVGTVNHA